MKTIVLTLSRNFPKTHPSAGKKTHFVESILNGNKKTTIRGNYERWQETADKLAEGTHILSLRYWSDKPYRSKQIEFAKCSKINLKEVFITNGVNGFQMSIEDEYTYYSDQLSISKKEGFEKLEDFTNWFQQGVFSGVLVEFLEI
jgi:hypothetical protein